MSNEELENYASVEAYVITYEIPTSDDIVGEIQLKQLKKNESDK